LRTIITQTDFQFAINPEQSSSIMKVSMNMKTSIPRNIPQYSKLHILEHFCDIVREEDNHSKPLGDTTAIIKRAVFDTIIINEKNARLDIDDEKHVSIHEHLVYKLLLEYKNFCQKKFKLDQSTYNEILKEFYFWYLELLESFTYECYASSRNS
jgi:hypothetical protein